MHDHDLEARLARLERRTARWMLVGVGATLASVGMLVNACSTKAAPPPTALDLQGASGQLRIDGNAITLAQGDARVTIEPARITLVAGDRSATLTPGQLLAATGAARLTLTPEQLQLANDGARIEGRLEGEGPTFALTHGAHAVRLAALEDVSAVTAETTVAAPTERVKASLMSTARGAEVSASRIGETKSLAVEKPAAAAP